MSERISMFRLYLMGLRQCLWTGAFVPRHHRPAEPRLRANLIRTFSG